MSRFLPFAALASAVVFSMSGSAVRAEDEKPATTEAFVSKAIDCNMCEKDLAERAVKNASTPEVREFAQQLLDDHEKMGQKIRDFAKEKKIGVVTQVSKEHKECVADLNKLKGRDYDMKFIQLIEDSHEKAITHLEKCSKENKDDSVRTMIDDALPMMKKHLERAREIEKKLK